MSKLKASDLNYFELNQLPIRVANQCAPLLCGIKVSNILILRNNELEYLYQLLEGTLISVKSLYMNNKKSFLLLYDYEKMAQRLQEKYVRQFMKSQGYQSLEMEDVLDEIANRFKIFKEENDVFPHELGIVLGYPVWDVTGFMRHKGKNCLYTGYWKVYKNLSEAKQIFLKYDVAKHEVVKKVKEGKLFKDIVEEYQIDSNSIAV